MKNRSASQCRALWAIIDPFMKKGPWSEEEKAQLVVIVNHYKHTMNIV
jgi:hypothetical protein